MEHPSSKHRNLRHISGPEQRAAALAAFGVGEATADAAGLKILELRQRDMQELFGEIFGVETKSSNNEWLRSKLLQAVGLPPRWRPAPARPSSPPADRRSGEYSRFGRRLRATVQPGTQDEDADAGSEAEAEEEEAHRAKRARASSSGASRSSGSRGASRSPSSAADLKPAAPPAPPAAPSGSSGSAGTRGSAGSDAIFSLQARAAATYASMPAPPPFLAAAAQVQSTAQSTWQHPAAPFHAAAPPPPLVHPAAACYPALFYAGVAAPSAPLQSSMSAAVQHPPQLHAQQLPCAPPLHSVAVPLAPQCAADRASDLAALLSQEGSGSLIMPALPPLSPRSRLHSAMLQTSLHAPPGFATLSAQLHMLDLVNSSSSSSGGGAAAGAGVRHNVSRVPELDYFARKLARKEQAPQWCLPYGKAGQALGLKDAYDSPTQYLGTMQAHTTLEFQAAAQKGLDSADRQPTPEQQWWRFGCINSSGSKWRALPTRGESLEFDEDPWVKRLVHVKETDSFHVARQAKRNEEAGDDEMVLLPALECNACATLQMRSLGYMGSFLLQYVSAQALRYQLHTHTAPPAARRILELACDPRSQHSSGGLGTLRGRPLHLLTDVVPINTGQRQAVAGLRGGLGIIHGPPGTG
ncbi:hypothetical protein C2E20_2879 [Micractinium conductrix]|uniref:Uncharacterized protein n=1 Tax=Micractinium conductrix TaxID=554055 RepID=A0A2P6VIJ0_9CHLO|nr:hypothetical protein C2E20_2879 [Micractinium conductrix]|eukprot:PSC73904.1 hypothetical protein C2E20_2879 [Micractinium conductrix]